MDTSFALKAIAEYQAESTFIDEYKKPNNLQGRMDEGLGCAIAHYCEWDGIQIMKVFQAALDDANFHAESTIIASWIGEDDDSKD